MDIRARQQRLAIPLFLVLALGIASSCRGPDASDHALPANGSSNGSTVGTDETPALESQNSGSPSQSDVVPAAFLKEAKPNQSTSDAANPIDGDRSYGYLKEICKLGPRPTGSQGMAAQQKLVADHFSELGGQVSFQRFRIRHPQTGKAVPVANMIIQWHPQKKQRILLCAHYDTRPLPDNPRVSKRHRGKTFIGANDGASGVALLMELAHFMPTLTSNYGVDFVLLDAEEFVFGNKTTDKYFYGSEYYARSYVADPPGFRYRWGVLFDMIGDKRLNIYQEKNSVWWKDTRPLVKDIWATAARLGVHEFIARPKYAVKDDHLALRNIAKIPTCDIIDFDYPKNPRNAYWHTADDTPDKCSGESLAKVGWVALEWLKQVK